MDALLRCNEGYAPSYGTDPLMDEVRDNMREIFEAPNAAIYLVATGTTANVLSLATLVKPYDAIYCHREAHIEVDEAGGPEFYTGGAKLTLIDGADGKILPDALRNAILQTNQGFVHSVQRGAISITNATECGAIYSPNEVAALNAVAEEFHVPLHMDGARFANAVVSAGCTPAEMTWKAGVDILSFGGTKNGLLGVEAVILFNPDLAWDFEMRRKRGGHLFSKHRYLSAQMHAYLQDNLWLELAENANRQAEKLATGLLELPGAGLVFPRQANAVFAKFARGAHKRAIEGGAKYYLWPFDQSLDGPDEELLSGRLMCSWCTSDDDIEQFLELIRD